MAQGRDPEAGFEKLERLAGDPKRVAAAIDAWIRVNRDDDPEVWRTDLQARLEARALGAVPLDRWIDVFAGIPARELWRRSRPPEAVPDGVSLPDGAWRGWFAYLDAQDRHRTSVTLTFGDGRIHGRGQDEDGPYEIDGRIDPRGAASWTKTYPEARTKVTYTGRWSPSRRELWGGWTLDADTWGRFVLHPADRAAPRDIAGWPTWLAVDALHDAIGAFQAVQEAYGDLGASDSEPDVAFEVALKHAWRGEPVDVYWELYEPDTICEADGLAPESDEADRARSRYEQAVEALDEAAGAAIAILQQHPDKAALGEVLRGILWRVDLYADHDVPINEIGFHLGLGDEAPDSGDGHA